jgi:hypothetical protein
MKTRFTNEQIQALAGDLVEFFPNSDLDSALRLFDLPQMDDVSQQTLLTLIFQCPICGLWKKIEDIDGDTCRECNSGDQETCYEHEIICSDYGSSLIDEAGTDLEE